MEPRVEFCITNDDRVRALLPSGGFIETQSVEAHLLYAILNTLENIQARA
jgi:hypothetical protein